VRSGGAGAGNSVCWEFVTAMQWIGEEFGRESGAGAAARIRAGAFQPGKGGEATSWGGLPEKAEDLGEPPGDNVLELPPGISPDGQDGERDCVGGRSEAEDVCGAVSTRK